MSDLSAISYPGQLRRAVAAVRDQRDFVLKVAPSRPRQRLLALLPVLEGSNRQLTVAELFFALPVLGFMGLYFSAKGSGYRIDYEDAGELRVQFHHEPAV